MLRIDLEAAGVPYVVDGVDGPLFADFHCLRHTFIAMLDKAGATLKEAMQLARHSDPKLTMAIYGRAGLADLGNRVERPPSLSAAADPENGIGSSCLRISCGAAEETPKNMIEEELIGTSPSKQLDRTYPLGAQVDERGRWHVTTTEKSSAGKIRTFNPPVNSRLLYH
jgi:hypothetical protein